MPSKLTSTRLLDWYDENARVLAWRVSPQDREMGIIPDPYQVWLSEVMLQQTTVAAVDKYFCRFIQLWPRVQDLAEADEDAVMGEWAGLGYYARARNLLRCARVVASKYDGRFPETEEELLTLPGIGPYTAAAISAIAFDGPSTVLDGNVERVISRVYAVEEPLPKSKEHLRSLARGLTPVARTGDYAQAIMDLGATICTPRNPDCERCPWRDACKSNALGIAETLPRKLPNKAKPTRLGGVYIAVMPNGDVVMERRPEKGLLGGMLGWPGGEWSEGTANPTPPFDAGWTEVPGSVHHVFTHFRLELSVYVARGKLRGEILENFEARDRSDVRKMPTVMRKAWDLAAPYLSG